MLKISVETVLAQQGCEEPEINNDSEQIGLSRRKEAFHLIVIRSCPYICLKLPLIPLLLSLHVTLLSFYCNNKWKKKEVWVKTFYILSCYINFVEELGTGVCCNRQCTGWLGPWLTFSYWKPRGRDKWRGMQSDIIMICITGGWQTSWAEI